MQAKPVIPQALQTRAQQKIQGLIQISNLKEVTQLIEMQMEIKQDCQREQEVKLILLKLNPSTPLQSLLLSSKDLKKSRAISRNSMTWLRTTLTPNKISSK
jgi:hypothetical protein